MFVYSDRVFKVETSGTEHLAVALEAVQEEEVGCSHQLQDISRVDLEVTCSSVVEVLHDVLE